MSDKVILYRSWKPTGTGEIEGAEIVVWGEPLELTSKEYDFSQPEQPEPPPAPIPAFEPLPALEENICGYCGAISIFAVEVCDLCGEKAKKIELQPARMRKLSFDEFEAAKRRLNRLSRKLADVWFERPAPPERAKLEANIEKIEKLLEDNIYLALLFQPGRRKYYG